MATSYWVCTLIKINSATRNNWILHIFPYLWLSQAHVFSLFMMPFSWGSPRGSAPRNLDIFSNTNSQLIHQKAFFFPNLKFGEVVCMLDLKFRDPIHKPCVMLTSKVLWLFCLEGVSKEKHVCMLFWETYQGIWDTSCALLQHMSLCCQQNCALLATK